MRGREGFTLIELIVVMTIIAILVAMGISVYFNSINKARLIKTVSALDTLKKVLESYTIDHNGYPLTLDLSTFTDQDGKFITDVATIENIKRDVFSFDGYAALPNSYSITAKALDSKRTVVTVTPERIAY